jgi:hypothetical protein
VLQNAKDEPFGGKSLARTAESISRVSLQTSLAGKDAVPPKELSCNTPPTPGGENHAVFTSFLISAVFSREKRETGSGPESVWRRVIVVWAVKMTEGIFLRRSVSEYV